VAIGAFRPVTLWPFPEQALAEAAKDAERILVYEVNAGQMIDDVRLSVGEGPGDSRVVSIGGVSVDYSGMRQGELLSVSAIRTAISDTLGRGG
jgi:2-oxoglutarate ferredoxin oxidoreductase subunit alpha